MCSYIFKLEIIFEVRLRVTNGVHPWDKRTDVFFLNKHHRFHPVSNVKMSPVLQTFVNNITACIIRGSVWFPLSWEWNEWKSPGLWGEMHRSGQWKSWLKPMKGAGVGTQPYRTKHSCPVRQQKQNPPSNGTRGGMWLSRCGSLTKDTILLKTFRYL